MWYKIHSLSVPVHYDLLKYTVNFNEVFTYREGLYLLLDFTCCSTNVYVGYIRNSFY